jgi:hypothetical protein
MPTSTSSAAQASMKGAPPVPPATGVKSGTGGIGKSTVV